MTSPRNGPGWRCLFCWGSDYALYRFVLTLHFLPAAVFYALATRFSNTARLFYSCPLFGQDQTKADRILRNCFEGANMPPRSNQTSIVACNTCPYHGWNWCELKGPDTSICSIAKSVQSSSLPNLCLIYRLSQEGSINIYCGICPAMLGYYHLHLETVLTLSLPKCSAILRVMPFD